VLIGLVLVTFCCLLLADGLVHPTLGSDVQGAQTREGSSANVADKIKDGGSVIDAGAGSVESIAVPDKTVALTFDDGPDPVWTPQILEVLRRHQVPGTFFVLGSHAAEHPDLVRDIDASGSELGVHTFSHPDLVGLSADEVQREMSQTQLALAGATGKVSYLVRPPYSSVPSSLDDAQLGVMRELGEMGYVTALSDVDSRDWERPGVNTIVAASTPAGDAGGSILLHDAGGDRSQTVAALDRLIPELKARGYRFSTVSGSVGLPAAGQPASSTSVALGTALLVAVGVAGWVVSGLEWALLAVGVLVVARLLIMLVVASRHRRQRRSPGWSWGPPVTEPVSVVVPAFNERECIASTVSTLVASDHPVEVIVVDDGSTDGTADIVEALARRHGWANVRVIRQANAGKPAALNAGIAAAGHGLIVMIDGDTVLEPSTVRTLVQPFADPAVGAVAGNAKVANRSSLIARWQHIEYVIGFNIDRRVFDRWRCMPTVPGAVGAFRRQALRQVGGISDDTLAEDTDVTMALCRAGWRVVFEERARGWTEAPATLSQLWRQRYRWSYGTMQSMWKHRRAVLAGGPAGRFGRLGLLNLGLFQVVLPLLAPLVDVFLVYGLLFLDPVQTVAAWATVLGVQLLGAVFAFRMERESLRPLWLLPLQQLVYRQLMYAVLVQAVLSALAGVRLRWQKLRRIGDFTGVPLPPATSR
jgi:cellulose synthase/poly-beta-1,6-N-acetylglucosamine synthase-like glycosyltransferase/peptidoglycan/xylan/chitin deacetylase (PgdA/CDA1 family)